MLHRLVVSMLPLENIRPPPSSTTAPAGSSHCIRCGDLMFDVTAPTLDDITTRTSEVCAKRCSQ